MFKTWILVLSLISSPVLAQTKTLNATADVASTTKLAGELVFCNFYFVQLSQCFADERFDRSLSSQDKARLVDNIDKWALKAAKYVSEIARADVTPHIDLAGMAMRSAKRLADEIAGDCTAAIIMRTMDSLWRMCGLVPL